MSDNDTLSALHLPKEYAAVSIDREQDGAAMKICVVVRRQADPAGGHLVVLRETFDARVLLACLTDRDGQVHQWLELWVQNVSGLAQAPYTCRAALTNDILDERWRRQWKLLREMDGQSVLATGWEEKHPPAMFVDVEKFQAVVLEDEETHQPWHLCENDEALAAARLPRYRTSLHRYLRSPQAVERGFIPVTPDAPTNPHTQPLEEALSGRGKLVPLNGEGGLLLVRAHRSIPLERYVDILGGETWSGCQHGRVPLELGDPGEALKDGASGELRAGRLFLGTHGRAGRLVESFHLKLCLLADLAEAVRAAVQRLRRPLLNLKADSFRVEVARVGQGLPSLWTARADLVDGGSAVVLPVQTAEAEYYLRACREGASVYWPAAAGLAVRGHAAVRIRKISEGKGKGTVLEGTFAAQERITLSRSDLAWLRLNLGASGRVDLYARLEEDTALASGEWRFRTVEQEFRPPQVEALRAAEGVPIVETPFEIIPLLSTPCDLYSLGVLAVQTLLVNPQTSLPVAMDEALSLARQVAVTHDESQPLPARIEAIFASDERWGRSLGPHRLVREDIPPAEAMDLIPSNLWWSALAMIVRTFPGIGPDSACRDLGDAVRGGGHRVFETLIRDLKDLIVRTRSLIVIDWRYNREIHAVIRALAVAAR